MRKVAIMFPPKATQYVGKHYRPGPQILILTPRSNIAQNSASPQDFLRHLAITPAQSSGEANRGHQGCSRSSLDSYAPKLREDKYEAEYCSRDACNGLPALILGVISTRLEAQASHCSTAVQLGVVTPIPAPSSSECPLPAASVGRFYRDMSGNLTGSQTRSVAGSSGAKPFPDAQCAPRLHGHSDHRVYMKDSCSVQPCWP